MAGPRNSTGAPGDVDNTGAKDPSGGQPDNAVGNANASAGTRTEGDGAVQDNGNGGPTGGSLDANLAEKRAADAAEQRARDEAEKLAVAERTDKNEPVRLKVDPNEKATPDLDKTIPGGRTFRADGVLQNAHGLEIDTDGTILDTPHNRERAPLRFTDMPR